MSNPEIQDHRLIQYLKATHFDCCRCTTELQPLIPDDHESTHGLGTSKCARCHKPPCNHCAYRSSMIKHVKASRVININLDYQRESIYGFVCCSCGHIQRVVPEHYKHKFAPITSSFSRLANLGKTAGFQVNFQSQGCGGCGSKCCYECFCFLERDSILKDETNRTSEPLSRTATNISTMSKMSGIARSVSATVKATVQRTASRAGSFLSRKNSTTGNKYPRLTEPHLRDSEFLATEFPDAKQSRVPNRGLRDESVIRDTAASNVMEFMDHFDDVFHDF